MRMRTNIRVSLQHLCLWVTGFVLRDTTSTRGISVRPTAAMRGCTQDLMIPQQSCSHDCFSSHSSAVPQPRISKSATLICSFSCSALENNLVFFQIPVNSLTRWLPVLDPTANTAVSVCWHCNRGIWSSNTSLASQPPNSPRNWKHCVHRAMNIKPELIKLHCHQWHVPSRITNPTPGLQRGFNWGQHSDGSWQHPSLHEAWCKTAKPNVC